MDVRQRAKTTLPPARIIERSRSPRQAPPQAPEKVDDLLQAYLGGAGESPPAAFGESAADSSPDMNSLLRDYLDEPIAPSATAHDVGQAQSYPDAPPPQILADEVRVDNSDRTNDTLDGDGREEQAAQPGGEDDLSDLLKAYVEAEPEK